MNTNEREQNTVNPQMNADLRRWKRSTARMLRDTPKRFPMFSVVTQAQRQICGHLRLRLSIGVHSRLQSYELTTTPKIYFFLEELALHARD
jgi:hypothetical protein